VSGVGGRASLELELNDPRPSKSRCGNRRPDVRVRANARAVVHRDVTGHSHVRLST